MINRRLAAQTMIALSLLLIGSQQHTLAAPQSPSELSEQLKSAAATAETLDLETVETLQRLLKVEAARLKKESVAPWIKALRAKEFNEREAAEVGLVEAGAVAIPSVLAAAKKDDREVAERCVTILARIAKSEDKVSAANAEEALSNLGNDESPIGRRAAQVLTELHTTDRDRSLKALANIGARIRKNDADEVTSISAYRGFSDREMNLLRYFPRITYLTLGGEGITDAGVDALVPLKHLRRITLMRASVTDIGLAKLGTLQSLDSLMLNSPNITSAGLHELSKSRSLQSLNLFKFMPDDASISVLNNMKLRTMTLSIENAIDEDLKSIEKLSSLSSLMVMDSPKLTDKGLESIANLSLRALHIDSPQITDGGLIHLSNMSSLHSLYLTSEQVTDVGLQHLGELKSLTSLHLRGTSVTDEGVDQLKATIPTLQRVYR